MTFDWCRDLVHDPIGILTQANRLWEKQAFTKPSEKRRKKIKKLLYEAIIEIESILEELEE